MKILTDNDGDVIFFNKENIKQISRIFIQKDKIQFNIFWLDGTNNGFSFMYDMYETPKDILISKIEKVRLDLIKELNDGKVPALLFPEINLKKPETNSNAK